MEEIQMDRIKICALGGLDEHGRDCYLVEINDLIYVLDCGIVLADKTIPGIDCMLPNASYLIQNKDRIAGYIITHSHEENAAGIKYFYKKAPAPIYTTKTTALFLISQAKLYHINVNFNFKYIDPNGEAKIGDRVVTFFQTAHNAPNSFGLAIPTDKGNIIYTGDFIVDFSISEESFKFNALKLEQLSYQKTLLLMCESKGANKIGYCSPRHKCKEKIRKYFVDNDGRIFFTCFWQNGYRVKEILDLAKEFKRKVYFYDKYTETVVKILVDADIGLSLKPEDIISHEDYIRVRRQEMLVLILDHSVDIFDKIQKLAYGNSIDKRIFIEPMDTFINGAIPTETMENEGTFAVDAVYRTGCDVIWLSRKECISMHARQDDIKTFLSFLKPKYYMPVRGRYVNLMDNAKLAVSMGIGLNHMNIFVLDNGMQISIDESGKARLIPNSVNKIPVEPGIVDGTGISVTGTEKIIEERKKLGVDGVVIIATTISKSKKAMVTSTDCQMRGFVYSKDCEPLVKTLVQIFNEELNLVLKSGSLDFENAFTLIKERCLRFIRKYNGREPLIDPLVLFVD